MNELIDKKIATEIARLKKAEVIQSDVVEETISTDTGLIYNPHDYQSIIATAIAMAELPNATAIRFDQLFNSSLKKYIWLGCSPAVLPDHVSLSVLKKHNVIIGDRESMNSVGVDHGKVKTNKVSFLKRMKSVVGRLRNTVQADRLDAFVRFSEEPTLAETVTLIDRMLVDLELTHRPKAAIYRMVSSRIVDFGLKRPTRPLDTGDIYDINSGKFTHRSDETKSAQAALNDHDANVAYTHVILSQAMSCLADNSHKFEPVVYVDQRSATMSYQSKMHKVMKRFGKSWCHDIVQTEQGKTFHAVRTAIDPEAMCYVTRYLLLTGHIYVNVTTGLSGALVTSNVRISKSSKFELDVRFAD